MSEHTTSRAGRFHRIRGWWGLAAIVLLYAAGLGYAWLAKHPVSENIFGTSTRVVGTLLFSILFILFGLIWFFSSHLFTGRVKFAGLALVGLALVGAIGSVRGVEHTGDNIPVVHFRWSPTAEDRLAEAGRLTSGGSAELVSLDNVMLEGPGCNGFLGPNHSGHIVGVRLPTGWQETEPKELWRAPVGGGYAAFAVQGDIAVTIEQRGPAEVVAAYDARTGKPLWTRSYDALFSETMGGDGPRATPTIADGVVYSLGAKGRLEAIQLLTSELLWARDILKDASTSEEPVGNVEWGMAGSPLVTKDLVIVSPGGKQGRGLIAYERENGEIRWANGNFQAAYASPMLATIAGVDQVLIHGADVVTSHDLETGKELWRTEFAPTNGIACSQPVAIPNDRVFLSASYGAGCKLLQVNLDGDTWSTKDLWTSNNMRTKFSSAIYVEGYIYGLDDGIFACVDVETGKRTWKRGRYGHGQVLYAEGLFFVQGEQGDFIIVEANPKAHREVMHWQALPGLKNWNAPALAGNRLYLRNHYEMASYELGCEDAQAKDAKEGSESKDDS